MEEAIEINDNDDLIDKTTRFATNSGFYRLWLAVFISAVDVLKNENDDNHNKGAARSFLFEDPNPFFDLVADELGYTPSALRGRIRKALEKHVG